MYVCMYVCMRASSCNLKFSLFKQKIVHVFSHICQIITWNLFSPTTTCVLLCMYVCMYVYMYILCTYGRQTVIDFLLGANQFHVRVYMYVLHVCMYMHIRALCVCLCVFTCVCVYVHMSICF